MGAPGPEGLTPGRFAPALWVPWEPWELGITAPLGVGPRPHGPLAGGGNTVWERQRMGNIPLLFP